MNPRGWRRRASLSPSPGDEGTGLRPAGQYSTDANIKCFLSDYWHAGVEYRLTDVFGPGQIPAVVTEVGRTQGPNVRLRIINTGVSKVEKDVTQYVPAHKGWAVGWRAVKPGDYIAEVFVDGIHQATLPFTVVK